MLEAFYTRHCTVTADGSHTLYLPALGEHYHSANGAVTESRHVFLKHGFDLIAKDRKHIRILEVGFGTGLNAILTLERAVRVNAAVEYVTVEPYPLNIDEAKVVSNSHFVAEGSFNEQFLYMHAVKAGERAAISPDFSLLKEEVRIQDYDLPANYFHLVYHDAFAPQFQQEMWTVEVFKKLFSAMLPGGILTTYCAKGSVKRALKEAGFLLSHPEGPPGKREMTVASKEVRK